MKKRDITPFPKRFQLCCKIYYCSPNPLKPCVFVWSFLQLKILGFFLKPDITDLLLLSILLNYNTRCPYFKKLLLVKLKLVTWYITQRYTLQIYSKTYSKLKQVINTDHLTLTPISTSDRMSDYTFCFEGHNG